MADSSIRVLYAEDSALDADLTKAHFEERAPEFDLEVVDSGRQCLARLAAATYDVLLLDNRLPDMDGVEVLKQFAEWGPPLPVVVVTAAGDEALVVQLLRMGAWDYVAKQSDYLERLPAILRNAVEEYRRLHERGYAARRQSRRILYAEHHPIDVDLTLRQFAEVAAHLRVDVVRSATEALQVLTLAQIDRFDLVLADLRMPDMSALDLLREVRRRALPIPFIVITGRGDEEAAVAALKLGAYDYIVKRDGYLTQLPYAIDNAVDRFQLLQLNGRLQLELAERQLAETRLRESEARFRSMIEHASDAITIVDERATVVYASPSYARVLGLSAEERIGTNLFERIHPDDLKRVVNAFRSLVATPGRVDTAEFRLRVGSTWRHLTAVGQNLLGNPAIRGVVINTRDVSARVAAHEALRASEARFRALVEQSPEAIVLHAGGRILYLNPAAAALLGVSDARSLVGTSVEDLMHPQWLQGAGSRLGMILGQREQRVGPTMYRLVRRDDGRVLDVEITSVLGTHEGRPAVQSHLHDVTERKRLEARLTHQAFHDPLTGLANRVLFRDRVEHALRRAGRGEHMAVVLLDLDDFKTVNDSLGHAAGDELLTAVAQRLLDAARGSDTVARLGGDEFVLLVEGLVHDDDVGLVLERVRTALRQPVAVTGREVSISASLGVAHARGGASADELVRNADVAMYRAKADGKGRFAFFTPEMHAAAVERLELEADLRAGLARGEFTLVFQPFLELATGRVIGAEALVRWEHPVRGTVAPAAFIPAAERMGLIVPLGRWVLEEACRQARAWEAAIPGPAERQAAEPAPLSVSVNVSARQLAEPEFTDEVATALAKSHLPAPRLLLEITESVMLHDAEAALATLCEIRALGVRLAIDDFGTGYSALAYLERFPIDVLKMDKSFTDRLGRDAAEPALPRAIMALGRSLGLRTVAEGIETQAQLRRLHELGCDIGQGYLLARPLGAADFVALLQDSRSVLSGP